MNRRRFSRPRLRINVRASSGQKPLGHVLDITDEGVCLAGRGAPPLEARELTLSLPWALSGQRELHLRANPRWHSFLPNGHWRAGFFVEVDEPTALLLSTLSSRYGERP